MWIQTPHRQIILPKVGHLMSTPPNKRACTNEYTCTLEQEINVQDFCSVYVFRTCMSSILQAELAGRERRTRLRKEGASLKLISAGRPRKGARPFLGARSHLLGEHHGNSRHGPQPSEQFLFRVQI